MRSENKVNVENNGQNFDETQVKLTALALGEVDDPQEVERLQALLKGDDASRGEFEATRRIANLIRESVDGDLPLAPGSLHDIVMAELKTSSADSSAASPAFDAALSQPGSAKGKSQNAMVARSTSSRWSRMIKSRQTIALSISICLLVVCGVVVWQPWGERNGTPTDLARASDNESSRNESSNNDRSNASPESADEEAAFEEFAEKDEVEDNSVSMFGQQLKRFAGVEFAADDSPSTDFSSENFKSENSNREAGADRFYRSQSDGNMAPGKAVGGRLRGGRAGARDGAKTGNAESKRLGFGQQSSAQQSAVQQPIESAKQSRPGALGAPSETRQSFQMNRAGQAEVQRRISGNDSPKPKIASISGGQSPADAAGKNSNLGALPSAPAANTAGRSADGKPPTSGAKKAGQSGMKRRSQIESATSGAAGAASKSASESGAKNNRPQPSNAQGGGLAGAGGGGAEMGGGGGKPGGAEQRQARKQFSRQSDSAASKSPSSQAFNNDGGVSPKDGQENSVAKDPGKQSDLVKRAQTDKSQAEKAPAPAENPAAAPQQKMEPDGLKPLKTSPETLGEQKQEPGRAESEKVDEMSAQLKKAVKERERLREGKNAQPKGQGPGKGQPDQTIEEEEGRRLAEQLTEPADEPTVELPSPSFENLFVQPLGTNALSTFSIDTDTASFTNIRQMLRNGQRPHPDQVRIEEMVNFFEYAFPQPKAGEPFSVNLELASSPWSPGNQLLRVGLKAREVSNEERPPSNLVFLIDVSGSMRGQKKLPWLKKGLSDMVDRLREDDYVSIVTYSDVIKTPLQPTDGSRKTEIKKVIASLTAKGSTNGSGGLQEAYRLARENFLEGGTNRIVMGTDGDFNVGIQNDVELVKFIRDQAESGVFLTICGFGTDNFKDRKVQMMAQNGNGKVYYVDSENELNRVFVERISGNLVTIAKDVKLQMLFNPRTVQAYRLIGYETRMLEARDFDNDEKDAGEMDAGDSVTALYEIVPADDETAFPTLESSDHKIDLKYQIVEQQRYSLTESAKSSEMAALRIRFKEPESKESSLREFVVRSNNTHYSRASRDMKFVSAVAGLGLLLKNSEHRGSLNYAGLKELAQGALFDDRPVPASDLLAPVDPEAVEPAGGASVPEADKGKSKDKPAKENATDEKPKGREAVAQDRLTAKQAIRRRQLLELIDRAAQLDQK